MEFILNLLFHYLKFGVPDKICESFIGLNVFFNVPE